MTPEQKQLLANRILSRSEEDRIYYDDLFHAVGHSHEEYDKAIDKMRNEFYQILYPVESKEYETLLLELQRIQQRLEELVPLLGLSTTGPIPGNPYIYLTMLVDNISDWDTAKIIYWERMNKSYLKDN